MNGLTVFLYAMPLAIGIGYILGARASGSWFLGSVVGWFILIPLMAAISYAAPDIGAATVPWSVMARELICISLIVMPCLLDPKGVWFLVFV